MPKVLITGGAGNIGSSLAIRASLEGHEVVVLDNLSTGRLKNISDQLRVPGFTYIKGDVNQFEDIAPIMTAFKFDYVFHYAAVVGVQRTLENPAMVLRDIDGIRHILNLSKNTGVKRIFYSSSSEVYGEPVEIPQHETTTPLNSRLPYAIVKNLGEAYCHTYYKEYGLSYTIFRFFNTYGENQTEDFVVSRFVKAALKGDPIQVYGDGLQSRTFCHIDDNIEFTLRTLKEGHFMNDVVNVGNDDEITVLDLAKLVKQITQSNSPIVHLPPLKEGDMSRRKPDISKMKRVLQRNLIPLSEGIKRLVLKNQS